MEGLEHIRPNVDGNKEDFKGRRGRRRSELIHVITVNLLSIKCTLLFSKAPFSLPFVSVECLALPLSSLARECQ